MASTLNLRRKALFSRLWKRTCAARSALPALKAGLGGPDANVRTAFQSAINQIEKAKPEPGEEVKKRIAILKDLDELQKARTK